MPCSVNFKDISAHLQQGQSPMEWSQSHDVFLCCGILAVEPFQAKRKTTARAKYLEKVAELGKNRQTVI